MKTFDTGSLVYILVRDKLYSEEGLSMGGEVHGDPTKMKVYQSINMEDFPGFNDYLGYSCIVCHKDKAIILESLGRPDRLSNHQKWDIYDVYKIMTPSGHKCSIFKFNLKKI